MGPPPCGGGKAWPSTSADLGCFTLQWGRLHAEAERKVAWLEAAANRIASMGPPPCGGGKRLSKLPSNRGTPSFNGAASMRRRKGWEWVDPDGDMSALQWGRLHAEAERIGEAIADDRGTDASMGPPPCGGGKIDSDGFTAKTNLRFNGAASMRRRKGGGRSPRARPRGASMGPPPCGGGKVGHCSTSRSRMTTLQWGRLHAEAERTSATFTPVKDGMLQWGRLHAEAERSAIEMFVDRHGGTLQWGRLHAEAERSRQGVQGSRRLKASMGPPPCGGGKRRARVPHASTDLICFNGAASMRRRKVLKDLVVVARDRQASMGPPPCGGGKGSPGRQLQLRPPRFNGAASMRRRKAMTRIVLPWPPSVLQWGRLHAEAESAGAQAQTYSVADSFNGAASMRRRKVARTRV